MRQVDVAATISVLLDLPIPYSSIGRVVSELIYRTGIGFYRKFTFICLDNDGDVVGVNVVLYNMIQVFLYNISVSCILVAELCISQYEVRFSR